MIVTILQKSGYDTAIAIQTFNLDVISSLETHIIETKELTDFLRQSPAYSNIDPKSKKFSFLPGHKALLLGLVKKSEEFERFEESKNKTAVNQVPALQSTHSQIENEKNKNLDRNAIEARVEDSSPDSHGNYGDILLKLKNKVSAFVKNLKGEDITIDLDISKITTSVNGRGKAIYKCTVKCLYCESRLSCQYSKHWQISNYEAHLKRPHSSDLSGDANLDANAIQSTQESTSKETNDTLDKNLNKSRISIGANAQSKINEILNLNVLNLTKS